MLQRFTERNRRILPNFENRARSIIERSALARCNVLIIRNKNTLQIICSATFALEPLQLSAKVLRQNKATVGGMSRTPVGARPPKIILFLRAGTAKCWKLVSFLAPGCADIKTGPKSVVGERGPVATKSQSSLVRTTRALRGTVTSPSDSANHLEKEKSGCVPTNTCPFTG